MYRGSLVTRRILIAISFLTHQKNETRERVCKCVENEKRERACTQKRSIFYEYIVTHLKRWVIIVVFGDSSKQRENFVQFICLGFFVLSVSLCINVVAKEEMETLSNGMNFVFPSKYFGEETFVCVTENCFNNLLGRTTDTRDYDTQNNF